MAAYASLVSVMHITDNLQLHSRPPITLHKEQASLLTKKIAFLLEFLQVYNPNLPYSKEADPLESRIARAAYAAEDAIESHILDQISNDGEKTSPDGLYEALEKVIEEMALIEKEAMDIKETVVFRNQLHTKSTTPADSSKSSSSSSIEQKMSMMVGADDMLLEMKDKLTSDARELQTIPIVGMGGSGLQVWTSEASHFPRLEQLHLSGLDDLAEIPLEFAEISTLRLIAVEWCCDSAVESAKRILDEQEELYGEEETTLQIQVKLGIDNNPVLASLRSSNLYVR